MEEYQLSESELERLQRRTIIFFSFVMLFSVVFSAVCLSADDSLPVSWRIFGTLGDAVAVAIIGRRRLRRSQQERSSYRIVLEDDYLVRIQAHLPDVRFNRSALIEICEGKNCLGEYGLHVASRNAGYIFIPKGLEDYAHLRARLSEWLTIGPLIKMRAHRSLTAAMYAILSIFIVSGVVLYISMDMAVVLPLGLLLSGVFTLSFISGRLNRKLDPKVRRSSWLLLLFAVLPLLKIALVALGNMFVRK
ncbi:MAG: hypothetical protein ACREDR_27440 [Blastocatellia bacterium]